jgi:hypothetical protein
LLIPLIVFAALAIIQVALVVRDELSVVYAAREAARAAGVDGDAGHAETAARHTLAGAVVTVGPRGRVGSEVTVEVKYRSVTSLPLVGVLFPNPMLHAKAVMRVER